MMAPAEKLKVCGIEVKITDRCNQQCFHCVNEDGHSGRDLACTGFIRRLQEWKRCEQALGWSVREVRMTGGEPLMHAAGVARIARACRELGIKSGINTNAIILSLPMAERLKDSGLSLMKVSYDASDEETLKRIRGTQASLARLEENLSMIAALGFELVLRFSLCRYNAHQLPQVYRNARRLKAQRLQIKPLIPCGRALLSDAFLTREEINRAFGTLASLADEDGTAVEILCWPPEDCSGLPSKLCGSTNKIYVAPDGQTTICNYVSQAKPLGNFIDGRLSEILARHQESIARNSRGQCFVAGCPQAPFF